MNRGEMRAAVQRNLGRAGVTSTEDSDLDRIINQTIREDICADHNWSAMETITVAESTTDGVGTKTWPTPTTYKDTEWVQVRKDSSSDYVFLQEMSELALTDSFSELTTAEGLPVAWARQGTSYLLRPIPDATYTLRIKYWAYPAEIATGSGNDSSTNFVLTYWTKLLEFGCTARAMLYYGETERAAQWTQLYRDEMGKAISVDRRVQAPANLTLKPSTTAGKPVSGLRGVGRWPWRIRGAYS